MGSTEKKIALYKTVESCNRLVIPSTLKKIESNKAWSTEVEMIMPITSVEDDKKQIMFMFWKDFFEHWQFYKLELI